MKIKIKKHHHDIIVAGALLLIGTLTVSLALRAATSKDKVILAIPYVSQVPTNTWINPWANACEEASALMVEYFYTNKNNATKNEHREFMSRLFEWENKQFGYNDDTSAEQTKEFINNLTSFTATVKRNPTLEEILQELQNNRPVIAFVNQHTLYLETPSRYPGNSLHVFVIQGFDENKQQFIIHDPARKGKNYSYSRVLNALHDYNPQTKEADGEQVVLFTSSR
jgi:hypothetical protein